MGIIAESWLVDQSVQLKVQRLTGRHRLGGAITLGTPARGEALLFRDCRSLHGWFMRGPLDAVFFDASGRVLTTAQLRRWRLVGCREAAHALELAPGEAARLGIVRGKYLRKIAF